MPYSARAMYDLVADVRRYPEFVPHCTALRVLSERTESGQTLLTAEMVVAYHAFREKFRCSVQLVPDALMIDVDYLDGPFRRLKNHWRFHEADRGSEIDFTIDFEFRNVFLQAAASALFEHVFSRMSEAFIERARAIHGAAEHFGLR